MFLLFFAPVATGWLSLIDDAESIDGVRQHRGKWVHTAARSTSPAPCQINRWLKDARRLWPRGR